MVEDRHTPKAPSHQAIFSAASIISKYTTVSNPHITPMPSSRTGKRRGTTSQRHEDCFPRVGRPVHAIIEENRKTELCRNWEERKECPFGENCAFAHGTQELKYRTPREMESAGRIPDASKYRCYPCLTWVATGSCPYATRCVFIHDPRIKGPTDAWLYSDCHPNSAPPETSEKRPMFFFPDMELINIENGKLCVLPFRRWKETIVSTLSYYSRSVCTHYISLIHQTLSQLLHRRPESIHPIFVFEISRQF
ncbi:unnamed protein product [Choristocarpus tenellus]